MSLRFIYGRSGSGKSYYCFKDIQKKLEKGEEHALILLVPEQFSFQTEKNLIHYIGEKAMERARVLSFKRLAQVVFNEVGGIIHQHINESGKSMLIYKIMQEHAHRLKIFNKAATREGFVSTMSELITEFKRYNISPEILYGAHDGIQDQNLQWKMEDISLIYSQFEENLHKKYIDSEDDLTLLIEKLDKSKLFHNAEVWIDEFFDYTPQQYNILEKIMKQAKRVNITLATNSLNETGVVDNLDLFYPAKSTENKILKIAEINNISFDKPIALNCSPCYRFKESKELSHMEQNIFSYPYKIFKGDTKDICMFKALNKYSEIEDTARDILRLVRDKRYRFKDIAVVTGDLNGYENLIRAIFDEHSIPYFIDKKREIVSNPLIVLILSSIEIMVKRWSYEAVFRYLKTGLTDISREDIDLIENYVLANGIRGKKWTIDTSWNYRIRYSFSGEEISEAEQESLNKINEIRFRIIKPLIEFHGNIKGKKTGKEMSHALYDFLMQLNIEEKTQSLIEMFKEENLLDKVNEYRQIWDVIVDIMDQIAEVINEDKVDSEVFGRILKSGFEEYELGLIPPAIDQILVSSVQRIRSHDIKALYIVGVNDGVFPGAIVDEGILTDLERESLRINGLELAKDTKSLAFEDQFLTYVTLTIMSKYLRLSYPIASLEGKSLRPSIVISRMKKIFPELCEKSNIIAKHTEEEDIEMISTPKATFNELISELRGSSEEINLNKVWLDVYRWYRERDKWNKKLNTILQGFSYSNDAEILDTQKVRKLYGHNMNISVSRLEKYASCPFAYFVKYGLNAKDRKIYKLTSPDLGSFMHEVLDNFTKYLGEKDLSWENADKHLYESAIANLVDEKIQGTPGAIFSSSPRYEHMTKGVKKILVRTLEVIGEQIKRGDFKPQGSELSFNFNGDFPPISVELHSGEKVNLIGRVDRLDTLKEEEGTYIRIIDYKSGTKKFSLVDVYYGLQLQLLVYLDALLTDLEEEIKNNTLPAGVLYFKIDDPIVKGTGRETPEEIEKKILKNLKMQGLLLEDVDIIRAMDKEVNGYSDILPVALSSKGEFYKNVMGSLATKEEFDILRAYVKKTIVNLCEEMLEGNISIKPYKRKDNSTPCGFCEYSPICQFDTALDGNSYKNIQEKSTDEVWEMIKKEVKE